MSKIRSVFMELMVDAHSTARKLLSPVGYSSKIDFISREIKQQEPNHEIIKQIGPDLNAVRFFVSMDGKVKLNTQEWISTKKMYENIKKENIYVEEIQANPQAVLFYEGLSHLKGLRHIKYLNLNGQIDFDDWSCDKLAHLFENSTTLEKLDISNCPNVTEKGISILRKIPSLRELNITETRAAKFEFIELFEILFSDLRPEVKIIREREKIASNH